MYRILTSGAYFSLILGIIAWLIAITAFVAGLYLWYRTGEFPKFYLFDYLSENWVYQVTANWPDVQKDLFWILNRTIPLLFAALGLVLVMIYLIVTYLPRFIIDEKYKKEEELVKKLRKQEKSKRIKKLTKS